MDECANCQSLRRVIADLQESESTLAEDVEHLTREMRRQLRIEANLRRELRDKHEADPRAEEIREVMEHWRVRLKHPKAKIPLDGERASKTRAALKLYTVTELKEAIDGCARRPFVGPRGRQSTNGNGAKRFDDLALILRNETMIERFRSYLAEDREQMAGDWSEPVEKLLYGLKVLGCSYLGAITDPDVWESQCPGCRFSPAHGKTLTITRGGCLYCVNRCDSRILERIIFEAAERGRS